MLGLNFKLMTKCLMTVFLLSKFFYGTNTDCPNDCRCSNGTIKRFCSIGFYFNATSGACQDINECLMNCKYDQSICINFIGSFNCSCPKGSVYNLLVQDCAAISTLSSFVTSTTIVSSFNNSIVNQSFLADCTCTNGTIQHFCSFGFYFNATLDINECLTYCKYDQSVCINLNGSFNCTCPKGLIYNLQVRDCAAFSMIQSSSSIKKVIPSGYLNLLDTLSSTVVLSNNSIKKVTPSGYLSSLKTLSPTVVLSNYSLKKAITSGYLSLLVTSTSTVVLSSLSIPLLKQTSPTLFRLDSSMITNNKAFQINESSSIIKNVATSTLIQSSFSHVEQKKQSSFSIKSVVSSGHLNSLEIATSRRIQSSLPLVAQTSAAVIQLNSSTVHVDKIVQTSFSIEDLVSSDHLNVLNITTSTVIYSSFNQSFVKQSYCKEETVGSVNFTGLYTFPFTLVKISSTQMVSIPCVYNTSIMLNRRCIQSDPASDPYWSTVNLFTCPSKTETSQLLIKLQLTNITSSNAEAIASNLKNVLKNGIVTNEYDIYIVSNVIKNIIKPSSLLSEMVTNDVLSSVDIILGVSPHIIDVADKVFSSSAQYLSSLEMLAMQQTKNITISKTNLAFSTYFPLTLGSLYIYANPVMNNINLSITDKDLRLSLENLQAYIFLPAQVFKGNTGNVYWYVFKQGSFFKE
ncbi:uncharacterized protein LOC136091740 [Hydra vulgaris]|uniref:Uncharacterized protein LOC136091740 n=1 Tax=Hydra vulgaris TaxID=6087 RepID=A0ABM4DLU6_HYDVU